MLKKLLLPLIALLFITSCEQVTFDDLENEDANVVLQLSCYQRMPFATRSMPDVTELCSRINIVIFNGDTKLKTITQKSSDSNYGTIAMTLAEGTYKVVVIAHNGEGTATISSIEKVTFANNHITDTFYYYGDLNVKYLSNLNIRYLFLFDHLLFLFQYLLGRQYQFILVNVCFKHSYFDLFTKERIAIVNPFKRQL